MYESKFCQNSFLVTCLLKENTKGHYSSSSICCPPFQSLCQEVHLYRKCRCQSSPRVHVRRCTGWSRWTSCMTWSALDSRRVAKTPARYCWISCLHCCLHSQMHDCILRQKQEGKISPHRVPKCQSQDPEIKIGSIWVMTMRISPPFFVYLQAKVL